MIFFSYTKIIKCFINFRVVTWCFFEELKSKKILFYIKKALFALTNRANSNCLHKQTTLNPSVIVEDVYIHCQVFRCLCININVLFTEILCVVLIEFY